MTCKGCLETVMVTEEVIQQLVKEADDELLMVVTEEIYEARLKKCESCPSLQYGTTCVHSGCIIRYRAKFKNKSCPNPDKPKWIKVPNNV